MTTFWYLIQVHAELVVSHWAENIADQGGLPCFVRSIEKRVQEKKPAAIIGFTAPGSTLVMPHYGDKIYVMKRFYVLTKIDPHSLG